MTKRYIPHKFQKLFHKSSSRFRTLIAGRRGGKTLAGTIEGIWWADRHPGTLGYIVAPTFGVLEDINLPLFFEWLPPGAIKSFTKGGYRPTLELKNGSTIRFRSGDKEDSLRGPGMDWLWLDEGSFMKPYVWDVLLPALTDKGGRAWVTTTPQGFDWIHRTFYQPAVDGKEGYEAWQYRSVDNPHLDKQLIEDARESMNEQIFRQEYLATFEKFSGLVYPDFGKDHIAAIKPEEFQAPLYFIGIDVGYTNPTAIVLMVEDAGHRLYVIDEWYESKKTAPEIVAQVKKMTGDRRIEAYIIDPASKGTHQTSQMSMEDQLRENGLPVQPGNNNVRSGIDRMTQLIRLNALKVHPRCTNTIREFEVYSWKENKNEDSNLYEAPKKVHDHLMDAIRYVAMGRPDWFGREDTDRYGVVIPEPVLEEEGAWVDL